jgi:hypothetical protein
MIHKRTTCRHGLRSRNSDGVTHWRRSRTPSVVHPGGGPGLTSPLTAEDLKQPEFPAGWDSERVRRVLEHYERQSDDEAVAEDEAAYESTTHTSMEIPVDLVPEVRELLAKRRAG